MSGKYKAGEPFPADARFSKYLQFQARYVTAPVLEAVEKYQVQCV